MKIIGLDHFQICIPKGAEAEGRQFYLEILGGQEIEKPDALKPNGGFWMKLGSTEVHIGTEAMEGKSKRHPAFAVSDLEAWKNHLSKHQIKLKENTPIPGVKRFSFYDYWDNRIEFLSKD